MYISHRDEIEGKKINIPGAANVTKQVLVGAEQGWEDYVMRMFTLGTDGNTPRHSHEWPHIIYIVEGRGSIHMDGKDHAVRPGSTAFVPGGVEHNLKNSGPGDFVFICIVPKRGES